MNKYIESDLFRLKGKASFKIFVKEYFKNGTFRWQVAYRLVRSSGIPKLIGRVLRKINRNKKKICIPIECDIGYGLYIGHGGPVVINPTAVIGNKIKDETDIDFIKKNLASKPGKHEVTAFFPYSDRIRTADREGKSPYDVLTDAEKGQLERLIRTIGNSTK